MQRVVIITGGYLNIAFAREYLKTLSYDKVFAVDKGLEYADALGILPDYLIGDFDTVDAMLLQTYERRILAGEITTKLERYPAKKDASDTELAFEKAMELGAKQVFILGGTGNRLDHVLANLGLLLQSMKCGITTYIVDETNRIRIVDEHYGSRCILSKNKQYGKYISLLPITDKVYGVTLTGVQYPLENAILYQGSSLTVSNQIVGEEMLLQITKGTVLLIESKDD